MEKVASMIFHDKKDALGDSLDAMEQEVTKERLLELAALESSILDAVPQAIVGLHKRRIIFANNAVRDTFGWDPEELIGKSVTLLYRNKEESEEIARYFYSLSLIHISEATRPY